MKKVLLATAFVVASLAGGSQSASAQPQSGSCGPHRESSTPEELVFDEVIDMSIYPPEIWGLIVLDITAIVDKNDDGIVCYQYRTPNPGQDQHWSRVAGFTVTDYVATFVSDNNHQGPS